MKIYVVTTPTQYVAAFTVRSELVSFLKAYAHPLAGASYSPDAVSVVQFEDNDPIAAPFDITLDLVEEIHN